jgi:putative transposase
MPSNAFYKLYYHVVWTTKDRSPTLTPSIRTEVVNAIRDKCLALGCHLHAANAAEDHVHVALEIRPSVAISTVVGQIKGASSHEVNQLGGDLIHWQDGYGVVSFRENDLPGVIRYVENQEAHHKAGKLSDVLEQMTGD